MAFRVWSKSHRPAMAQAFGRFMSSGSASEEPLVKLELLKTSSPSPGQIALLTLNDPAKMNAITVEMGKQLEDQVRVIRKTEGVRAAILTGAGTAFTAGGDYDWLLERNCCMEEENESIMIDFYKRALSLRKLKFPVIGCLNGAAIGAGMSLAVGGCDIRVAHTKAKLGFTFVKLGIHPGMAATHFLPRLVGDAVAAELLLTGRIINAQEAKELGIVSRVSDNPMDDALAIANEISYAAPGAVRETVSSLRSAQERSRSLDASMTVEASAQARNYVTKDFVEGVFALREKRDPVYYDQ